MYTVIGMNSICNPNLKHKGVQFLEVSRVYKHLRFTPVPLTNPKITFEVFKIWKQKTIFVVKSQMTQFFEDSLLRSPPHQKTILFFRHLFAPQLGKPLHLLLKQSKLFALPILNTIHLLMLQAQLLEVHSP